MSRIIKLTQDHESLVQEMIDKIWKVKMLGGEFKFTAKLPEIDRKATVIFKQEAYIKMLTLLMTFESEVGWYAVAHRHGELDDDIYVIDDVLVFPQIVTGTTVDSDDDARIEWFNTISDEELINIRGDFHSHVNMGTSPSGTDDKEVEAVLENLDGDAFRIFMIWNKKLEFTCRIFDMEKNVFFGTKDVDVEVEGIDIEEFLADAKDMVSKKTYSTSVSTTTKKKEAKKEEEEKEEEEENQFEFDLQDIYGDWYEDEEEEYYRYYRPSKRGLRNYYW